MRLILVFILMSVSFNTIAQFTNQFPAKKEKTISFKFGIPLVDNYKWMESYEEPDLYIWRDNQNLQTKSYLSNTDFDHYKAVQEKLENFYAQMSKNNKSTNFQDKAGSSLYEVSYEEIQETGGNYGSLQRIIIREKESREIKEIRVGYYFDIIKWINDETYVYTNFKTRRLRQGYSPYVAVHRVGDNPTDDKILLTAKDGDFFEFHRSQGNLYLNHFDGLKRDINVSLFNPLTGKLSNTIKFGTKMQQIGEDHEGESYFHYIAEYRSRNYGEILKVNIKTGERISLYIPEDMVAQDLRLISPNKYLLAAYKDGESILGMIESGVFQKFDLPNGGQIRIRSIEENFVSISWQSYSNSISIFEYDIKTKRLEEVQKYSYPTKIETKKVHYTAANGEKAFIWISKLPETQLTQTTPLILYGYGGWYHSELPSFNRAESLGWIEKGGVFAVAAIPGSLAYGMNWNQIAKAHNREKSFDSMANAAKELIKRNYTSSNHIGIFGASNGGLLVAGTLLKYPKLFKAAVPAVGVYDLINCNERGVEWELGNPCNKSEFIELKKISPIHNVSKVDYPSVLVMTADQDSVTKPTDSYKFAANLQEKSTSKNPILVYTKMGGGHSMSSGSSTEKLNYIAYLYSFFEKELGLN